MKIHNLKRCKEAGFSLLELMISVVVFVLIVGAVMGLLSVSQKRYRTDSQLLNAFQEARLGLDQIARDINSAGYPPQSQFSNPATPASRYASTPVAWNPGYVANAPCTVGTGACFTPGNFDLIVEADINNDGIVEWVRYQLQGTTLLRGVTQKVVGADPVATTDQFMTPYITNVVNNTNAAEMATLNAAYPGMFPGGNPVPVFSYTCDNNNTVVACTAAAANNKPSNIRDVNITLIVKALNYDAQTNRIRAVTLNGRSHRINPNQ